LPAVGSKDVWLSVAAFFTGHGLLPGVVDTAVCVPIVGVGGKVEVGRTAVSALETAAVVCAGCAAGTAGDCGAIPW